VSDVTGRGCAPILGCCSVHLIIKQVRGLLSAILLNPFFEQVAAVAVESHDCGEVLDRESAYGLGAELIVSDDLGGFDGPGNQSTRSANCEEVTCI
jgi:hypothetical protein